MVDPRHRTAQKESELAAPRNADKPHDTAETGMGQKSGDLHQHFPGASISHYRCFLPDLAGFAA